MQTRHAQARGPAPPEPDVDELKKTNLELRGELWTAERHVEQLEKLILDHEVREATIREQLGLAVGENTLVGVARLLLEKRQAEQRLAALRELMTVPPRRAA